MRRAVALPPGLAGQLEELRSGATYLSVPLHRDVIQVGTARSLPTATIVVVKTPTMMRVQRTDGRPLQARIINRHSGAAAQNDIITVPMRYLKIRRIARGWLLAHDQQCGLIQLIATIVAFSIAKQDRAAAGLPPDCPGRPGRHRPALLCQ